MLCKSFEFAAAHRLYREEWSLSRNLEVFGKCANPNGHGHNYKLEVRVSGECDPETGMIIDASKLGAFVEQHILVELDHKNLDRDVPWLEGKISTIENVAEAVFERLGKALRGFNNKLQLEEILIWETSNIYAMRRR